MVPSRVAGGVAQSSSSSGIFFQADGQSQIAGNSHLSSNFGNPLHSIPAHGHVNMSPLSADASNAVLNSVTNSGPSIGASSLVTDANSGLSGGPNLQRNASFNTDSYMRLPASPMSFTSNNISMSGSSVMDGPSNVQQSSNHDPSSQAQRNQGASSATSLPTSMMGQVPLFSGPRGPNSFIQDQASISHLQKKPRLDIKQEDVLQQQVLQQLLQRQDSMHLQNSNPQLQAIIQQQRLRQQQQREQQLLQSMPPMQRAQLLQQQQLRQQLLQQGLQPASGIKRPYDGGVCARRLMQYLYHQRQRPTENTIAYWRKFVVEYYSSCAKKRWCLSLYDNVGHHSLGVFPQAAMDAWQCDICGSKSGRGFEATFEVLPRLNEIKFNSGVIDELLFLDLPRESRFPSGLMMLEYGKAVQESVYEQLRVVHEGQLRIIFTPDLKILCWDFCARRHEELLPRRIVAPQVNQLLQVAQKCQTTISESGPDGVSQPDLQANSVMVVTAGRQLARSLELQSLNDLGFSKRYVRCLQIAEVVNSMKDLMDFCKEQKVGPIEGLKNFARYASAPKAQMQKMQETEQVSGPQAMSTDRNMINKLMPLQHPGLSSPMGNNNQHIVGRGVLTGSAQAALALSNYQNLLMRQNSMNSTHSGGSLQQEAPSPFSSPAETPTTPGPSGIVSGSMQNSSISGFSSGQAMLQSSPSGNGALHQNHPPLTPSSQAIQHQMIQRLLQNMSNKNNGSDASQQSLSVQNKAASVSNDGLGSRSSPASTSVTVNGPASIAKEPPTKSNTFRGAAAGNGDEPLAPCSNIGYSQQASDLTHNLPLPDEFVADVAHEFAENGFFSNDLDDDLDFNWKA